MVYNPDNSREHAVKPRMAALEPVSEPIPIEWRRKDQWHIESAHGFYRVAKAIIRGTATYGAWFRPEAAGRNIPHHLGEHDSAEAAKVTCTQHARMQGLKP